MAGEIATAFVGIVPSAQGFGSKLSSQITPQVAAAGASAGKTTGTKFGGSMLASVKGFVGPLAAITAGTAVFGFLKGAQSDASDLNETVNKSKTIFGAQFGAIDKWASSAATSLGLPRQAALDAAAGFGDMFTQLGFGAQVAADMATGVVDLSADLGSFNNLPTEDVSQRIAAAFRGEYDSLQLLIPNINAARVQQEAMAATGKKNASELTAQEKAAAVLAIVNADGARAMGDFARTSGDNANQQKILTARFADMKTKIGQALIPVMGKLLDIGMGILDFFTGGGEKASGFSKVVGEVVGRIKKFITDNRATFAEWWEKIKSIFTSLKELVSTVVTAILAFWEAHGEKIMAFISQVWETVKTVIGSALSVIRGIIEVITGIISGNWGKVWDGIKRIFGAVWDTIKSILKLAWSWILNVIGTALSMVWEIVTTKFGEIVAWIGELPGKLADIAGHIWEWIKEKAFDLAVEIVQAFHGFMEWVTGIPDLVKEKAGAIWEFITDKAGEIKANVIAAFVTFGGWLATLPSWLADKAGDVWGWIVDAARTAAREAWNALLSQFGGGFDPEDFRPPPPEGREAGGSGQRGFGEQSFGDRQGVTSAEVRWADGTQPPSGPPPTLEYKHIEINPYRRESSRDRAHEGVALGLFGELLGQPGGGVPILERA